MMHAQDSNIMGDDNNNDNYDYDFSSHQRTIRWRIALGILSSNKKEDWSSQLAAQRAHYAQLVEQYPFPTTNEDDDNNHDNNDDDDNDNDEVVTTPSFMAPAAATTRTSSTNDFLDPLTAMYMQEKQQSDRLQQRELQYRKEKARRKRGFVATAAATSTTNKEYEDESLTEQEQQLVGLQIIDKDLARLPHPDQLHGTSVCCSFRNDILRQVLFLYQCTAGSSSSSSNSSNSNSPLVSYCGYQQGMHEIASYVLYALELEETTSLSDQSIYADTYTILQVMLTQLLAAYDVEVINDAAATVTAAATTTTEPTPRHDDRNASPPNQTKSKSNKPTKHNKPHKPLEQMGQRILQQLAQHDPVLYQVWMSSGLASIPPQLVFTKWIRLLFSREVTDVLGLWDALFVQMQQQHCVSLQQVAETVAVARLLVHRTILLEKHQQQHAHSTTGGGSSSSSDLLHYLMNMPVEESIQPLIQLLPPMLRGESVAAFLPPAPTMMTSAAAATASSSSTTRVGATLTQAFQSMKTSVNAQHPLTMTTTTPLRTPENADTGGLSRFSFSSVTEKLASQTQSIGKRLQQEWEQLAQQQQQYQQQHHQMVHHHPLENDQLRNYDDPPPRPSWDSNRHDDPYAAVIPSVRGQGTTTPQPIFSPLADGGGTPSRRRLLGTFGISPNQQLAQQMQKPLAVLQHFAMQVQRDQRHVPDQVWEALASLEVVRTKLGQS